MAARRLIIVLVVLFAISIAAAMIAPDRRGTLLGDRSGSSSTTSATTTSTTTAATGLPSGTTVSGRIDASAARPESVEAGVGDQLELVVTSERARLVEVPGFGMIEDAAPEAPATFNLLLREPGTLPIRDAETEVLLGRIEVSQQRRLTRG